MSEQESTAKNQQRRLAPAKVLAAGSVVLASLIGLKAFNDVSQTPQRQTQIESGNPLTWAATPIADAIDGIAGRKTIDQPTAFVQAPNGTLFMVPGSEISPGTWSDELLPPVSEALTFVPGHPNKWRLVYGAEPNGETLPGKIIGIGSPTNPEMPVQVQNPNGIQNRLA